MDSQCACGATNRLKRIEGQIRGVQRMVTEGRYCVDVLTQTSAIVAAIHGVEDLILENHLNHCVTEAIRSEVEDDKEAKIAELLMIVQKFRKQG